MILNLWKQEPREVRFIGFNREFSACLVLDGSARRAVRLTLPEYQKLHWRENPIQAAAEKSEPVAITRTALHLPICAASKAKAEAEHCLAFFPWQRVTQHLCFLESKDDRPLERLLRQRQKILRKTRPAREKALIQGSESSLQESSQRLKATFAFPREVGGREVPVDEPDLTLDDVKQGALGLLEEYLCDWWAKEFGLDLQTIKPDATAFRRWLERFAFDEQANTFNLTTRQWEVSHRLASGADKWEALEAAVRYELRFTDGARCWLDRVEKSDKLTPQEAEDFERLQESAEADGDRRMSREEVCAYLKTDYRRKNGETSGPMGVARLKKLCMKVLGKIPKFPIRLSVVKKLDAARKSGVRKRTGKLRQFGKKQECEDSF